MYYYPAIEPFLVILSSLFLHGCILTISQVLHYMAILSNTNSLTQTGPREDYKDDYWPTLQAVRVEEILLICYLHSVPLTKCVYSKYGNNLLTDLDAILS